MDGRVVAVQVEDFGLPKSAVGTVGQTNKIFRIWTLDLFGKCIKLPSEQRSRGLETGNLREISI